MRLLIVVLQILFSFRNSPAWKSLLMVKSKICHVSHCLIFPVSVYSVHTLSWERLCSFPVLIP
jgi:hypothetical protein